MDNLRIYEQSRAVPAEAKKPITGGRLKGKTDINPMWRIKKLTELFGPCGEGWMYTITKREFVPGNGGEIAVFVDIELAYKLNDGEWSITIPGTGGSMYVAKENSGLYTDDEAPKKALTDAISVACKALGIGADVYWEKDATKYSERQDATQGAKERQSTMGQHPTPEQLDKLYMVANEVGYDKETVGRHMMLKYNCDISEITHGQYSEALGGYMKKRTKAG